MRVLLLGCLYLVLTGSNLWAQNSEQAQGQLFAKFNLFGLLDPVETNLFLGSEYRFQDDWAVSADIAWMLHSRYIGNAQRTNGLMLRPAVRYYTGRRKRNFVEAELHYKVVNHHLNRWVGRDCVNEVPAYEELTTFIYRRQSIGLHIKVGTQSTLSKNNKWLLEPYIGIGIRKKWEGVHDEPNSCFNMPRSVINLRDGVDFYPAFPMGMKLVYRVK